MQTRLNISGHPVHPFMMTLPLALIVCAILFDFGALVGLHFLSQVGYWTLVAGLFAAILAVGAGMVDLWDLPAGAGKRRLVAYELVNLAMVAMFAIVCLVRVEDQASAPTGASSWSSCWLWRPAATAPGWARRWSASFGSAPSPSTTCRPT
ncbi:hypothetical protein Pflav_075230 [Phytohabitans flavus]|uniref:DUF2231 domain-containing protein n=1 Tax=Phytohabitans flavus TaxID=1076124 RepID=A0A6F8Y505_9ACTN|nr:DUF2231 domain-containing protein [Phytohabitans flavus]BCB81113.1 hypothetical protein Pflav_075230 [Phytohabitans flavus]